MDNSGRAPGLQSLPTEVRLQIFNLAWQDYDIAPLLRGNAVMPLMCLTTVDRRLRREMVTVWKSYANNLQETWHMIDCKDKCPTPYSPINEHRRLELARALAERRSMLGFKIAASIESNVASQGVKC